MPLSRRHLLTLPLWPAVPALTGCGTPLPLAVPPATAVQPEAASWLARSADRHGRAAYRMLRDINVSYAGQWRPLIDRIQPDVVDKPWRSTSQERLQPGAGFIAQAHRGPAGDKQVVRQAAQSTRGPGGTPGDVKVWYAGKPDTREATRTAAAVVADCYVLFLLGPLWLADQVDAGGTPLQLGERVRVDGRACQWVEAWLRPGLGLSAGDRVSLAIDRDDATCRRLRFTLEGHPTTQGAVAETDWLETVQRHGVLWPSRSYERVVHPFPDFPAHDWWLTGLDVNRGWALADAAGAVFTGAAAAPAAALSIS